MIEIRKKYLFLSLIIIFVSLMLFYKGAIFQEGNPLPVIKGIFQLNDSNTYVKIKDNPAAYLTKTGNNSGLFDHIEKENNVKLKEQSGSAYLFEGKEKNITMTSRQYSGLYQVWYYSEQCIRQLSFFPVPVEPLKEGAADENMSFVKSISLEGFAAGQEAEIQFYSVEINDGMERLEPTEIYAFLRSGENTYEIGLVSSYGTEDVEVGLSDRNSDGINEIEITGGLGATYSEMKIIGYTEKTKQFVKLLAMGTPRIADLDGDGREELNAVSAGILHPYADIYRWNENRFEKADIDEETGSFSASIENQNGIWYIVTGNYNGRGEYESQYYRYKDGKLLGIK